MNQKTIDTQNSAENIIQLSFKLIDKDHPKISWILSTSPQSKERFYFLDVLVLRQEDRLS